MIDPSQNKTCPTCRMAIPEDAKKCPYCHCFQSKLSMTLYHPAFTLLFVGGPLLGLYLLMAVLVQRTFLDAVSQGESFQNYSGQIKISSSDVVFGETEDGPTVAVVGRMRNESPVNWREVTFAVEFVDAEGRLMDAGQEPAYRYYLPAGEEAAFKVSFLREFPESAYAGHKVRAIWARDRRARW